jgi:hypothetical protein
VATDAVTSELLTSARSSQRCSDVRSTHPANTKINQISVKRTGLRDTSHDKQSAKWAGRLRASADVTGSQGPQRWLADLVAVGDADVASVIQSLSEQCDLGLVTGLCTALPGELMQFLSWSLTTPRLAVDLGLLLVAAATMISNAAAVLPRLARG